MDSGLTNHAGTLFVTDGLERLILDEIVMRVRVNALPLILDIPCGDGRRVMEMARLGASVLAADVVGQSAVVTGRALASKVNDRVHFLPCRLGRDPLPVDAGTQLDLVFCHYGLSFLPFPEARRVLTGLLKSLRIGGKLFVAVHGLHSALGEGYRDQDQPIETRFCPLAPAAAECYGIREKVCLYSERNLLSLLIEIGGGVLRTFTSTHGAVKGVAVRV
ncbi:MAG: class I SAM-dependent methyltransferase [Zoogloeaceae bacterium]|nr:class I SAM-dependent methyltransferase [Zoogloeaceae bacterium]